MKTLLRKLSNTVTKYTRWEYLPMSISNIPVFFFWIYFGIRSRSLFFFTRVNPAIKTGGMAGESKSSILSAFPEQYLPKSILISKNELSSQNIIDRIAQAKISFPFILKPDMGNRGFKVSLIKSEKDLASYLKGIRADLILQEYIDYETELGVFYYRYPSQTKGKISSLCLKELLKVTGDGVSTVEELMMTKRRSKLQIDRIQNDNPEILKIIVSKGEELLIEPIGNHNRGTKFINGNHFIDDQLCRHFDQISTSLEGIYYGRYDIKCHSIEQLKKDGAFKILEFNGANAEATHVYDPSLNFFQRYKDIYKHWKVMFEISALQKTTGVKSISWAEAMKIAKDYNRHKKTAGLET